jgi:hypothetical protein
LTPVLIGTQHRLASNPLTVGGFSVELLKPSYLLRDGPGFWSKLYYVLLFLRVYSFLVYPEKRDFSASGLTQSHSMASSDGNEPNQLQKSRVTNITIKPSKIPRRRLTLLSITILLNVLLWSSVLVLISSLYLIASDLNDSTNVPTELLTITSVSILSITISQYN